VAESLLECVKKALLDLAVDPVNPFDKLQSLVDDTIPEALNIPRVRENTVEADAILDPVALLDLVNITERPKLLENENNLV
jgi:hypothetical protein